MNLSELFPPPLPQIIPKPVFPKPKIPNLAHSLSYSMMHFQRSMRGTERIVVDYRTDYWASIWYVQTKTIAIYLTPLKDGIQSFDYYLFLTDPEAKKLITQKSLFDRFNSMLLRIEAPTLHLLGKDYWIFSDGVPWIGRRTLHHSIKKQRLPEKEILLNILSGRPYGF